MRCRIWNFLRSGVRTLISVWSELKQNLSSHISSFYTCAGHLTHHHNPHISPSSTLAVHLLEDIFTNIWNWHHLRWRLDCYDPFFVVSVDCIFSVHLNIIYASFVCKYQYYIWQNFTNFTVYYTNFIYSITIHIESSPDIITIVVNMFLRDISEFSEKWILCVFFWKGHYSFHGVWSAALSECVLSWCMWITFRMIVW